MFVLKFTFTLSLWKVTIKLFFLYFSYISVQGNKALFHHNQVKYTLQDKGNVIEMLVWELPKKQEKQRTLVWFKGKTVVEWHKIVNLMFFLLPPPLKQYNYTLLNNSPWLRENWRILIKPPFPQISIIWKRASPTKPVSRTTQYCDDLCLRKCLNLTYNEWRTCDFVIWKIKK